MRVERVKVSDIIIEFLISKGITDMFGYPGGVVCHIMDSASKYAGQISIHSLYHEQAAAFAACGYSQETCNVGVAYATSGPGATNLITGIANAYYDSIPVIFITGQTDTYALKGELPIRQKGFQETDIVAMVNSITKYAAQINRAEDIYYYLNEAYYSATEGNPGPVLLDIPADIQRAEVSTENNNAKKLCKDENDYNKLCQIIRNELEHSERPCLLVGNAVKQSGAVQDIRLLINKLNIPTVFSMPAFDVMPFFNELNFGFIGANGHRYANFVLGKSDLIITIGSRLDLKQVGNNRRNFVPEAKIIRIDIDSNEFQYPVHGDEVQLIGDLRKVISCLNDNDCTLKRTDNVWVEKCKYIKKKLYTYDEEEYTAIIKKIGDHIPDNTVITSDVGQSQVWLAQQLKVKDKQHVHMSAGHGSMGYSLPAAIGAYYASKKKVYSFNGDGGIQMNIQELQFLNRERIPIVVIIINNHSLGMIRGFQEANFNKNYIHTVEGTGYAAPDFSAIAKAYKLNYIMINTEEDLSKLDKVADEPTVVEVVVSDETILKPNFGKDCIQDQKPYLDRSIYDELMRL